MVQEVYLIFLLFFPHCIIFANLAPIKKTPIIAKIKRVNHVGTHVAILITVISPKNMLIK